MNKYPVWWDTTVTIYNKFEDPQTKIIRWYRTTIDGCFFKYVREKMLIGSTVLETDSTLCRIPIQDNFLEKYEWVEMPNDKLGNYFTLGEGDIVVKGAIDEDINEYSNGHRSSDFIAKHKKLQGCIIIKSLAINVGEGRVDEHYLVKGV